MELNKLYFYTATILQWKHLLKHDPYKHIILNSLKYLVEKRKIRVYAFVILPNHIHLLWELLELNGKELPSASFMKYTSHQVQKDLRENYPEVLGQFAVERTSRRYQFWQRDALPIELYSPKVAYQKLEYIHNNPCQGNWILADSPIEYPFSSANFYETDTDDFGFLSHLGEII